MSKTKTPKGRKAAPVLVQPVVRRVPFKCEACEASGHVEDPKPMESVSCECGARYLHYPDGKWKCVVRPVFR